MARVSIANASLALLSITLLVACDQPQDGAIPATGPSNVILLIGDGFGAAQMSLGIQYASLVEKRELHVASLMRDGNTGYSQPLPFDSIVIDSAAAATQMATGLQVRNDTLGLSPDGYPIETILDFDAAVGKALEFQRSNPDTLVIVTGDHAAGGFSFTDAHLGPTADLPLDSGIVYQPGRQYPSREQLEILFRHEASYSYILKQAGMDPEKLVELVLEHTGLEMTMDEAREALVRDDQGLAGTKEFRPYHGDPDDSASAVLGMALSRHTYVVWSTGEHTSEPVPTYGRGPGAEKLRGIYPNTHLYSVMREALEAGP